MKYIVEIQNRDGVHPCEVEAYTAADAVTQVNVQLEHGFPRGSIYSIKPKPASPPAPETATGGDDSAGGLNTPALLAARRLLSEINWYSTEHSHEAVAVEGKVARALESFASALRAKGEAKRESPAPRAGKDARLHFIVETVRMMLGASLDAMHSEHPDDTEEDIVHTNWPMMLQTLRYSAEASGYVPNSLKWNKMAEDLEAWVKANPEDEPSPPATETTGGAKRSTTCCIGCRCEECRKRFFLPAENQSAEGTGAEGEQAGAARMQMLFAECVANSEDAWLAAYRFAESRGAERGRREERETSDRLERVVRDGDARIAGLCDGMQELESKLAASEKELRWISRSQELLGQVALEAIRVIHCTTNSTIPSQFEPCETCSLGGVGDLRAALTRALGEGYTNLVWGADMNIHGEAWHEAEMKAADFRPGEREAKGP